VIKSGTGTEHPIQTSKVKVLYKGLYYDKTIFDAGSGQSGVPVEFSTGGTVRGFSFALQNMVVGDRWEIWIPYYLGYGAGGYTDYYGNALIKGYSTLIFDVELVSFTQYTN
jgi:FKBP-type peptidyl-prolyl cis-trans isomerase